MDSNEESSSVAVQRVSQLDACDLDRELHSLLKDQVTKALKYIKPRYWSVIEPEVDAFLRMVVLGVSTLKFHATVGQRLLNIKYRDEGTRTAPSNTKLMMFVVVIIGSHWIKAREDHIAVWLQRWPNAQYLVTKALSWLDIVSQTAVVFNWLQFLMIGKFTSPSERFFKLRHIAASTPQSIRQVSYEYLNRELLWHGFAEFLTFFVPLVNIRRIINMVCVWLPLKIDAPTSENDRTVSDLEECAICQQPPILPHDIGCRHVFCYYCIKSNSHLDPNYRCPKCGLQIQQFVPIKRVVIH